MKKRIRYGIKIFTLDRPNGYSSFCWDNDNLEELLSVGEKNYGLKMISEKNEFHIVVEYTNIIWDYKFYWGSYKKRHRLLDINDEKWSLVYQEICSDLKTMGIEILTDEVVEKLKNKEYFEYELKYDFQFKNYCI